VVKEQARVILQLLVGLNLCLAGFYGIEVGSWASVESLGITGTVNGDRLGDLVLVVVEETHCEDLVEWIEWDCGKMWAWNVKKKKCIANS
jgi:hypothetical protein